MIDYTKLQRAHELIEKCKTHYLVHIISGKYGENEYTLVDWNPEIEDLIFDDISALIAKLESLTQPEAKYKVGALVWIDNYGEPSERRVINDENLGIGVRDTEGVFLTLDNCCPTKSALIDHMIEHWQSMRDNTEYGMHTAMDTTTGNEMHKPIECKKCGQTGFTNHTTYFGGNPKCEHDWNAPDSKPECNHPRYPHGLTNHIRRKCPDCGEYAWFAEDKS